MSNKIAELVKSIEIRESENSEIEDDLIERLNSLKSANE